MNVGELRKALEGVPDHLPVATAGHFGELDVELYAVEVCTVPRSVYRHRGEDVTILRLDGLPVSYEEPD